MERSSFSELWAAVFDESWLDPLPTLAMFRAVATAPPSGSDKHVFQSIGCQDGLGRYGPDFGMEQHFVGAT